MVGHEHERGFTGETTAGPRRTAKRGAVVGGVLGAVLGGRNGPLAAGIGSLVGGTAGYAIAYALGTAEPAPPVHSDDLVEVPVEAPGADDDETEGPSA